MLKQRADQLFLLVLASADLAVTALCWVAAYWLRWSNDLIPAVNEVPPFWWCLRTLPIVLLLALVSFQLNGLYQLGQRWTLLTEAVRGGKAALTLLLLWLAVLFYLRDPYESRLATLYFTVLLGLGLVGARRGFGLYFRVRRRNGEYGQRALIVGTGRVARQLAQALESNNWLGIRPMGFVDDESPRSAMPRVGAIAELPGLVEQHRIDYVFVALPLARFGETEAIFRGLTNTLAEVKLVPDVPQLAVMGVTLREIEGLPILNFQVSPHGLVGATAKRAMDVALSLAGLVALSPLFALVAALVKLTSRGPVFYFQERMGLNGHRFDMVKFRTMRIDAEQQTGPVWAKPADDRRTPIGAFLRATSLDELPQLWNVLVGDMSLVGPRPERPFFIEKFRQSIPHYMLRHAVKAGITGWAQVHGWRGDTSLRKRVQYDLYYIANWSLWMDIRILFMTVTRVLFDKNAY